LEIEDCRLNIDVDVTSPSGGFT